MLWGFWCCSVIKVNDGGKFKAATAVCLGPEGMTCCLYSACSSFFSLFFLLFLIFAHYNTTTRSTTEPGAVSFYTFGKNLSFLSKHEVNTKACDCSVPGQWCTGAQAKWRRPTVWEVSRAWLRERWQGMDWLQWGYNQSYSALCRKSCSLFNSQKGLWHKY